MLKNYIFIALRNFLKHKSYTMINIAGLAIGMAQLSADCPVCAG